MTGRPSKVAGTGTASSTVGKDASGSGPAYMASSEKVASPAILMKLQSKALPTMSPDTSQKTTPPSVHARARLASLAVPMLLLATNVAVPSRALAQSVVVFGDSSADIGSGGPDFRPTNLGEMWSETLSRRIGKDLTNARSLTYDASDNLTGNTYTGGTSYAISGSTASRFDFPFTLSDQVSFYIQDRKTFGKDDLVFVWITRNDITQAFFEGVAYDPTAYANDYVDAINSMQAAGARNIVAFGAETKLYPTQLVLDAGTTQDQVDDLSEASRASDAVLWPMLKEKNVYIIDIDRLAEDVRNNPLKYGFEFTTENYQGRGDTSGTPPQARENDGNVFTGDGHYTTAMQLVVSDFALAQVRARDQYRTNLLHTGYRFRSNLAAVDFNRLQGQEDERGGWRVYGETDFEDSNAGGDLIAYVMLEQQTIYGTMGGDYRTDDGLLVGGSLALGTGSGDYDDNSGSVDQKNMQISGYVSKQLYPGFYIHATASGGGARFTSIRRETELGSNTSAATEGDTEAQYQTLAVGFGQTKHLQGMIVTGELQVATEKTTIDGYREAEGVLALSYGDSEFSSELLSLGFHLEREAATGQISPFASVKWTHDFNDDSVIVRLGPTDATVVDYVSDRPFTDEVNFQVGASYLTANGLEVHGALTATQYFGGSGDWGSVGLTLNLSRKL